MPADRPAELHDVAEAVAHRISPGDTVVLAPLRRPAPGYDASVFLEIWQPGGAQPPNGHPRSVETFLFLAGEGRAYCDEAVLPVRAGQLLVLPEGSLHRIENTGAAKLYAITTMTPDDGFCALVERGEAVPLGPEDRRVLAQASGAAPTPEGTGS